MKKTTIGLAAVALVATMAMVTGSSSVDERTEVVTEAKEDLLVHEKEPIVVSLKRRQVVIRKGNLFEPTEITVGYYLVRDDMETISSIATKLGLTEEYLMSVNTNIKDANCKLEKGALVEIPDADWKSLSEVYCLVSSGDYLGDIAEYFYTSVEDIVELNSMIKDPNVIYKSDLIQVQ